ncbi:MAG: hypothetical protein KY441_08905 [Actinobacteria bacterium]|nr:hypothetical protein [Actinomycetota bacterium]
MKGKWAEGIVPRNFAWVIRDQLAVCERLGGYGPNHRRVRRQEEILWVKGQGFTCVVSLLPTSHNLHAYAEMDLPCRHVPFGPTDDAATFLGGFYADLRSQLVSGDRVLVHDHDVNDRLHGIMAGYLVHAGLVPEVPRAIAIVERLLQRQMGPRGRELVAVASRLAPQR